LLLGKTDTLTLFSQKLILPLLFQKALPIFFSETFRLDLPRILQASLLFSHSPNFIFGSFSSLLFSHPSSFLFTGYSGPFFSG